MPPESGQAHSLRMPGEWERHAATWMAWPRDAEFYGERLPGVENVFTQMICALSEGETVKLLVADKKAENRVADILDRAGANMARVAFYLADYQDVWMRDYGPTFIEDKGPDAAAGRKAWVKWRYDGYNNKFPELLRDDDVFFALKDSIRAKMKNAEISFEGGAIDANGHGTILTTRQCALDSRNGGEKTQEEMNTVFNEMLGAENAVWLNQGLVNDHTDGHIDEVARFASPGKILVGHEDDPKDENYERLAENYTILEDATDAEGNKFELVKLPMPHMRYDDSSKAPVSYANFYIGNTVVLVSVFRDANDTKAIEILKSCFPGREVVPIDCRDLIYGGGAIHCVTQPEFE